MQVASADWVLKETRGADIGDERLNRRLGHVLERLASCPNKSIPNACHGWAETLAAYRFIDNKLVTPEKILSPHKKATIKRVKQEKVALILQDTSEIDYTHRHEIEGMGVLSHDCQQGFYLHPSIVVTPERVCLGVVNGHMWTREALGKRGKHKKKPIEEKESYRWIQSHQIADEIALKCPKTLVVSVTDREGDIYELLMQANKKRGAKWLVRAAQNRQLLKNKTSQDVLADKLWEKAKKAPQVGEIEFYIPATLERKARKVTQIVRTKRVCLRPPLRKGIQLKPVEINIVLCTEKRAPKGEKPLEWLLLTSVEIDSGDQALDIVQWYLCRWQIEIFFKILKSGCEIEELQFESFSRVANCLALYMIVAWRILYVTMLGRSCPEISCEVLFDEKEWKSVYVVTHQKDPPETAPKLSEMIRMIASLGGHLGRKHDSEPGPQTMWIGMQRMRDFAIAWEIFPRIKK